MPCTRKSCCYHTEVNKTHGCNYIFVTGLSKLGQMPIGEKYSIENCPFYKKGKRLSATKNSAVPTPESKDIAIEAFELDRVAAEELYNCNLCDYDIAMLLGVSPFTIAKWRRQKGLIRSMSKSGGIRRVNWGEVDSMLAEGYSDIAVSIIVKLPLEVIQRYKILVEKRKAERGLVSIDEAGEDFD